MRCLHFPNHATIVAACEFLADECVDFQTNFAALNLWVDGELSFEVENWLSTLTT